MKYLKNYKLFENSNLIKGFFISEDSDDEEEDGLPLDKSTITNNAYDLANNCGVAILSDKNLYYIFFDTKFNRLIAALFTSIDSDKYSFDIVVDRSYENMGLGTKLVSIAIEDYNSAKDAIPELSMEIDCINPIMAKLLKNKFGFEEGPTVGPNRIIMIKENILNIRKYFSEFSQEERKLIKLFLYLYEHHQMNHYGSFDYNKFYHVYYMLPQDFRNMIKYTNRKILYRGQEIGNKVEKQNIATFTTSKSIAEFMGDEIITNKNYTYSNSIDSEKLVKFISNRKNKELNEYQIGDDEGEVLLLKAKINESLTHEETDKLLDKISKNGITSLTFQEKKELENADKNYNFKEDLIKNIKNMATKNIRLNTPILLDYGKYDSDVRKNLIESISLNTANVVCYINKDIQRSYGIPYEKLDIKFLLKIKEIINLDF